jgi:hypothetical protein
MQDQVDIITSGRVDGSGVLASLRKAQTTFQDIQLVLGKVKPILEAVGISVPDLSLDLENSIESFIQVGKGWQATLERLSLEHQNVQTNFEQFYAGIVDQMSESQSLVNHYMNNLGQIISPANRSSFGNWTLRTMLLANRDSHVQRLNDVST